MSLVKMLLSSGGQDGLHALLPRLSYTEHDTGEFTIDPLPDDHRKGLVAVFVMAILSTVATLILISFVTYRLVFWRGNYQRYIGYNQYIILIYNLVIADIQQSLGFLICAKWYAENKVEARTAACFLQGLWLQVGDPASGIFVLAIAFHTFYLVALGKKLSYRAFVIIVIGLWAFVAVLVIIPIASHGGDVFVPAGAWVSLVFLFSCCLSPWLTWNSVGLAKSTKASVFGHTMFGSSSPSLVRLRYTLSYGFNSVDVSSSLLS